MSDRQSFTPFLHAFFDLVEGFAVWSPSTIRPRTLHTVSLTILRFLYFAKFSRTGLGFCDPAQADPFQVGVLLLEPLRQPFRLLAPVCIDTILHLLIVGVRPSKRSPHTSRTL